MPMDLSPFKAYVTLTKPGITLFIVMVSIAGFFAVSPYPPNAWKLLILVISGAMGSAGSASLNHYYDRDIDAQMKRTSGRPLPIESLNPTSAAIFGILLVAGALLISWFELNPYVTLAIGSGALVYVVVYTMFLKRRTPWGTVIGGYAGSAAVLGGGAAVAASFPIPVIALAILVFLWTPPHFWSLAIALSSDFDSGGVAALPMRGDLGGSARIVTISAALLLVPTAAFIFLEWSYLPFFLIATAAGLWFVFLTTKTLQDTSRKVAIRAFIASGLYLAIVSGAMVINWLVLATVR